MVFILVNVSVDRAILLSIYVSHMAFGVIVKPKYLKAPTRFILSQLQRMLPTGMADCFEMTMHPVFLAFN